MRYGRDIPKFLKKYFQGLTLENAGGEALLRATISYMSDDQFNKLFKYMEARFDEMEKRFDAQDKKIDAIYNILDAHLKKIEDILLENAARDRQQARMEQWIFQIADKLDLKLKYDQ